MSIEGVIEDVLETYPLQLKVAAEGATRHVVLRMDTEVRHGPESCDPGRLRPGQRVRIEDEGTEAAGGATRAVAIDILEDAPERPAAAAPESDAEPAAAVEDAPPVVEFLPSEPAPPLPPEDDEEGS